MQEQLIGLAPEAPALHISQSLYIFCAIIHTPPIWRASRQFYSSDIVKEMLLNRFIVFANYMITSKNEYGSMIRRSEF